MATGTSTATLADNAFALQTAPSSVAAASVTFPSTAEIKSLQAGDVIAAAAVAVAAATPYLRQIVSIQVDSPAAGQTTFTTTVASLDDVFATADLAQTAAVTSGDANAAAPLAPMSLNPLDFETLPAGGKEWDLGSEGKKGVIGLEGNAKADFSESYFRVSGGIDFSYQKISTFDLLPKHLRMVLNGGITAKAGAKVTASGSVYYNTPEVEYGEDIPLGTVIVTAGPIPIPIVISLGFAGSANVSLDTETTLHEAVTGSFQLQSGFDYTDSGGMTGVSSHKELINHDPFTVNPDVSGSFRLYPLSATLNFAIFDAAGPFLELDPYLGLEVDKAETAGGGATIKGLYGLEGHFGGDMTIFHKKLTGLDLTLFDVNGTFGACKTSDLVCSAGPVVEGE